MKELRRDRGIHANPWNHFPRLITSIDFLKPEIDRIDEDYADDEYDEATGE